jgi:predicted deacylase
MKATSLLLALALILLVSEVGAFGGSVRASEVGAFGGSTRASTFDPAAVPAGKKAWGYVPVVDNLAAGFDMPVMIVNGKTSGPTFVVTGGIYPTEFCGVEAAGRLYQELQPDSLAGRVVIIPVANMPVLQFRTPMFQLTGSVSPMDGKYLASVFPGKLNGTVTEVLAHKIFEFVLNSSYHVDLRGGDLSESHMTHTIFLQGVGGKAMDATTREMGTLFGVEYCRETLQNQFDTCPGTLIYEAMAHGVPSIISEAGTGFDQQPTEDDVQAHVTGVMNLLVWANMTKPTADTTLATKAQQFYLEADFPRVKATVAGIFKHIPDRGDKVTKGQRVGVIADLDGTMLEELLAPCDALVHEMMPKRVVYPGDTVYTLVVVAGPV